MKNISIKEILDSLFAYSIYERKTKFYYFNFVFLTFTEPFQEHRS